MDIKSLTYISSFALDTEITLTCGKELKFLEKELKGNLVLPSVPDSAPPEAPRAIIRSSDSIIAIGWNRFELNATPPKHIKDNYVGCLEFLKNRTIQVVKLLIGLVREYEWSGLIVKCHYPFENPESNMILSVFDKLINTNRNERPLSAFRLQFGYREGDYNRIYNLARYELRNINLVIHPQPGQKVMKFDMAKFPITESGLEINIDINNMTSAKGRNWDDDLTHLIKEHEETYINLGKELNLEGIIK